MCVRELFNKLLRRLQSPNLLSRTSNTIFQPIAFLRHHTWGTNHSLLILTTILPTSPWFCSASKAFTAASKANVLAITGLIPWRSANLANSAVPSRLNATQPFTIISSAFSIASHMHPPILPPNSSAGTISAGTSCGALNMPIKLTNPPLRTLLTDLRSVCAPPSSITWSTPLPPVRRKTCMSQSGNVA